MGKKGFTILEILVVLTVIAILIGIAVPRFKGMQDQGNIAKAQSELRTLQAAVETYRINSTDDPKIYPPTATTMQATHLANAPVKIITSTLYDPFAAAGTEYNYRRSANGRYYVIWSVGFSGDGSISAIDADGTVHKAGTANAVICATNGTGC